MPTAHAAAVFPMLSRRAGLRLAGATAIGVLGAGSLASCSGSDDDEPAPVDPLIAEESRARSDAATAQAAVVIAPDRAAALTTIATERTAHADALRAEIARVRGTYSDGSTPPPDSTTQSDSTTSPAATPPQPPPSLDLVRGRLTDAQTGTAQLARTQSDYRAGLLGSISAACAVHAKVLLR